MYSHFSLRLDQCFGNMRPSDYAFNYNTIFDAMLR